MLVIIGIIVGFFVDFINGLILWIIFVLYGGYVVVNVFKWIWWRFNGYGYFFGMLGGLLVFIFVL